MFLPTILVVALVAFGGNAEPFTPRADISVGGKAQPIQIKSIADNPQTKLTAHFELGDPKSSKKTFVKVYQNNDKSAAIARRDSSSASQKRGLTVVDLTPAKCNYGCYTAGSFQRPEKSDCDAIIAAQYYNSTGSLIANPGTFVYVYCGTCAVVFQNPMRNSQYSLQYNWAELGKRVDSIQKRCFKPNEQSIGGACKIPNWLKYKFTNVVISLQRIMPS